MEFTAHRAAGLVEGVDMKGTKMQKLLNECIPWLNWKVAAILGIMLIGVGLYAEWSSWSLWMGATPLLAIAVCVLPCLIPLAFLWHKGSERHSVQPK